MAPSPGAPPLQAPGDGGLAHCAERKENSTVHGRGTSAGGGGYRRPFVGKTGSEDFQDSLGHPLATRPGFRRFSAAPASRQLRVCPPACPDVPPTARPRPSVGALVMGAAWRPLSCGAPATQAQVPEKQLAAPGFGQGRERGRPGQASGHRRLGATVLLGQPPRGRTCGWGRRVTTRGAPREGREEQSRQVWEGAWAMRLVPSQPKSQERSWARDHGPAAQASSQPMAHTLLTGWTLHTWAGAHVCGHTHRSSHAPADTRVQSHSPQTDVRALAVSMGTRAPRAGHPQLHPHPRP